MDWIYVLAVCILIFLAGNFVFLSEIANFMRIITGYLLENREIHEVEPLKMFDFSAHKEKKSQNKTKKPTDRAEQWMKARETASRR